MGKIIEKNYDIYGKINKKIVLISDIHYYNHKNMKKLNIILTKIKILNPDYICIPGDLIDEAKIFDEDNLINFLTNLGKITKVIISVGNHELFVTKKHIKTINEKLIKRIRKIDNIIYLNNEIYKDNNINFIGITLPFEYFYKLGEDNNYFIDYFNNHFKSIDDGYNILLCHSPISISNKEVLDKLIIGKKINLVYLVICMAE